MTQSNTKEKKKIAVIIFLVLGVFLLISCAVLVIAFFVAKKAPIKATQSCYFNGNSIYRITQEYHADGSRSVTYSQRSSRASRNLNYHVDYDANGNILFSSYHYGGIYLPQTSVSWNHVQHKYRYNENGKRIREYSYDREHKLVDYKIYHYSEDDPEYLISMSEFNADGLLIEKEEYDQSGNLIAAYHYDYSNGLLSGYETYGYDDESRLVNAGQYDADGNFIYFVKYAYDSRGDKILQLTYDRDHSHLYQFAYEYDEEERLTAQYTYTDENELSSHNNLCFSLVNSLFLTFSFFHRDVI